MGEERWAFLQSVRHVCCLVNSVKVMYTGLPCKELCKYLPDVPHTGHCVAGHATSWYCLSSTLTAAHWILIHVCTPAKEITLGLLSITDIYSLVVRLESYMTYIPKNCFDALLVELAKREWSIDFSIQTSRYDGGSTDQFLLPGDQHHPFCISSQDLLASWQANMPSAAPKPSVDL